MRTTVNLEEDVILAAKEIAKQRGSTPGQMLSDLARQALARRAPVSTWMSICHFWSEDISILRILEPDAIITHAQITEVYMLGLALHKWGKLATLVQQPPLTPFAAAAKPLNLSLHNDSSRVEIIEF